MTRRVLAYGHRGAMGLAPENTLTSFRKALDLGVDGIELDIHLTADGEVVVLHDPTVRRTTGARGRVRDMSLQQLQRLDAAARHKGRQPAERIPTLEEVLSLAKGRARVAIELKRESPEALAPALAVVRKLGMEPYCSLLSFSALALREARRLAPAIPAELIVVLPLRCVQRARAIGAASVNLSYLFVTAGLVRRAHAAGLLVGSGIANTERAMRRAVRAGADTIYSDRPDLLMRLLAEMGVR